MKKLSKSPSTRIVAVLLCVVGISVLMGYGVDTSVQEEMETKVNTQTEQIDKQTKTIDYLQVSNSELEETLTNVENELTTVTGKYNETIGNLKTLTTDSQKTIQELEAKSTVVTEQSMTIEGLIKQMEELSSQLGDLQEDYEELKKAKAVSKQKADELEAKNFKYSKSSDFNWALTQVGGNSSLSRKPKPYEGKVGVGTVIEMQATAYDIECNGCIGITKTGVDVRTTTKSIIAVDPRVIPLGSKVEVFLNGRSLGVFSAEDTGGAIKGQIIDILFPTSADTSKWGRRLVEVKVLSVGTWGK